MRSFLLITVMCLSVPVMAIGRPVQSASDGPVLVIIPPWRDAQAIVSAAGGNIIGFERGAFGVLAHGSDPDFHQTVLDRGAWAVRDGALLAAFC